MWKDKKIEDRSAVQETALRWVEQAHKYSRQWSRFRIQLTAQEGVFAEEWDSKKPLE